jgi:hypothetical protein
MMDAYRVLLRHRIQATKVTATDDPTGDHIAEYGRAVMNLWDTHPNITVWPLPRIPVVI